MGLQSLRSELRAGHFLLCPAAEAGLDPFKTQVWEQSCPGFAKHFSQIRPSRIIIINIIIITITITTTIIIITTTIIIIVITIMAMIIIIL